jgi:hypothetical protein
MERWALLVVVALGLAVASGCDKKEAAPADPSTMSDEQIIEAGIRLLLDMSKISEANVGHCDRAADQLSAFVARHQALIAAFKRVTAAPAKKQELQARHAKDFALMAERSIPLEESCRGHERLEAVFATLIE